MKSTVLKIVLLFVTTVSIQVQAKLVFESNEEITINSDNLFCKIVTTGAHAGAMSYPAAFLHTKEIAGTRFKHEHFEGIAYTQKDFSCGPLDKLLATVPFNGRMKVQKNVQVHTMTYQDYKNGPIVAIETSETVRLTLANGNFLESRINLKEDVTK